MTPRTFLFASLAVGVFATPVLAVSQDLINRVANDLAAQGYTRLEIKDFGGTIKVEATGPGGQLERIYNEAGDVLKEEVDGRRTGGFGSGGNGRDDEDSYDDRDDDKDDDRDDDKDDDRDDDKDDDRDDDKEDDRDDDKDDDRDDDKDDDKDRKSGRRGD